MLQVGGGKKAKKTSSSTKRHFTVVMGNKEHGLYVSSNPSSAARKAVSKLCATDKKRKVQFSIREITQGSKKKTYGPYVGKMKKLDKPIELKGRIIKYSTDVYLDKKSSTVKTGKKVGNKMRGGDAFEVDLCNFIKKKYQKQIIKKLKMAHFTSLTFVCSGNVYITNRSKFLRKNNKPEKISIYRCLNDDNDICCYAILRYNDNNNNKDSFQDKVLFLILNESELTSISNTFGNTYEFKSFISSNGDLYRIHIQARYFNNQGRTVNDGFYKELKKFFDGISIKQPRIINIPNKNTKYNHILDGNN